MAEFITSTSMIDNGIKGFLSPICPTRIRIFAATLVYYQSKDEANIIDLGLSLKALQPEGCYPSNHENYEALVDWQQLHPRKKDEICEDEGEGIQSKEHWAYVKVNMDGVIVGRKICILDHMDYLSLALQLEDMFGNQSMAGLQLFQAESEFSLFYKDKDERWRTVGDAPWKEFAESVKRLRIVRKDVALTPFVMQ